MHKQINSVITFKNGQGVSVRGTLLKISKNAITFEVYNPYSVMQLSEVLHDVVIMRADVTIYRGKAVVSNLINTGLMLVVSVTLVDSWKDLSDLIESKIALQAEINDFIIDWENSHKIEAGYQLAVVEIRSFLTSLSNWLEQLDLVDEQARSTHEWDLDDICEPVAPKLSALLENFEKEAEKIDSQYNDTHREYAQQDLHPLIMSSPFTHRIYTKPLGYAGDHEMVRMIWNNDYEGPTIYSKIINKMHLNFDAAQAHRNRIRILEERLISICERARQRNERARILNIGCGPAIEILNFIKNYPELDVADFTLMDFNDETLLNTEKMINEALRFSDKKPTFSYVQKSVYSLLKNSASGEKEAEKFGDYDLVYCAGLFDYLADKACRQLVAMFVGWTRNNGLVLVTNVHSRNTSIYWMEHVLEWHLIYRDDDDMRKLCPRKNDSVIYCDDTGVNVFAEVRV